VVRQILPIVPQIVGMPAEPAAATIWRPCRAGLGLGSIRAREILCRNFGAQFGGPQFQSAFGAPTAGGQQRQLTQQDVADVTRQLIGGDPPGDREPAGFSNQQRMI